MRPDLAARYCDERLPRYTSYPTAAQFSDGVTTADCEAWLAAVPDGATGSLYLHVPFCRAMCWYCGCHTTITRRDGPVADYLAVLQREIRLVAQRLPRPLPMRHVHFGGGTPTIMEPAGFLGLVATLRDAFPFAPDVEVAVEIDPRTLSDAITAVLGEAGVTRASLGIQSFDPVVQQAVNRIQSFAQTAEAVEGLRAAGVRGVNLDLIYGLPHQTTQSCVETARRCLALAPDRFSVFGYAHVPAFKKHQRRIDEATLPDGSARQEQAEAIAGVLTDAGYCRIGLDHYALPGDAMARAQRAGRLRRNFQGYSVDPADVLIGLGASAIGRLPQGYVQNEVALGRYAARIGRGELATAKGYALTADDRVRADVIERLMCDFRVDLASVCRAHDAEPRALLRSSPRLQALADDGVVRLDGSVVSVPDEARLLVRSAASAFDNWLGRSPRTHSRAV